MTDKLRVRATDVLITFKPSREVESSVIFYEDKDTADLHYYSVVCVGKDVTSVKKGDTILISWANITPPFFFENVKYGLTDESQIVAVIDY